MGRKKALNHGILILKIRFILSDNDGFALSLAHGLDSRTYGDQNVPL